MTGKKSLHLVVQAVVAEVKTAVIRLNSIAEQQWTAANSIMFYIEVLVFWQVADTEWNWQIYTADWVNHIGGTFTYKGVLKKYKVFFTICEIVNCVVFVCHMGRRSVEENHFALTSKKKKTPIRLCLRRSLLSDVEIRKFWTFPLQCDADHPPYIHGPAFPGIPGVFSGFHFKT